MKTPSKIRLMIVDDNAAMRQFIRELLEPFADAVCECDSGEEALRRCDEFEPHFVTMDVSMKEMNGFQTTRMILTRRPATEIVIVAQSHSNVLHGAGVSAGATKYFQKDNLDALFRYAESRFGRRNGD